MKKECFIIMPISGNKDYDIGHFDRVYNHMIKPAVIKAGFVPVRADDIKQSNYIVLDIVQRLISSDMVLCDLSSKNPNVLYELGIRQSFNLPVSFIKDELTERIFDIQGFRFYEYNSSLRVDEVQQYILDISENIKDTYNQKDGLNSLIDILGIKASKIEKNIEISQDTNVILKAVEELSNKLNRLEYKQIENKIASFDAFEYLYDSTKPEFDYNNFKVGENVLHNKFGKGTIKSILKPGNNNELNAIVDFSNYGEKHLLLRYAKLMKTID